MPATRGHHLHEGVLRTATIGAAPLPSSLDAASPAVKATGIEEEGKVLLSVPAPCKHRSGSPPPSRTMTSSSLCASACVLHRLRQPKSPVAVQCWIRLPLFAAPLSIFCSSLNFSFEVHHENPWRWPRRAFSCCFVCGEDGFLSLPCQAPTSTTCARSANSLRRGARSNPSGHAILFDARGRAVQLMPRVQLTDVVR